MTPLSLQQIAHATNGRLIGPDSTVNCINTDTRKLKPQSLFIAIKGENHDGHAHLAQAIASGAIAAMIHEDVNTPPNFPLIQVDDTRKAMGRLAALVRQNLKATVIGVAGSNGKTGTKHLIDAVLAGKLRGTTSPKSFNNGIGVPLTIFDADPANDYLILEMGTNHPGEIHNLTMIARPDVAVITSIGAEHLEFLGDLDGVRNENAAIVDGMPRAGKLFINGDDAELANVVADKIKTADTIRGFVRFGFDPTNNLRATDVDCTQEGVRFHIDNSGNAIFVPMLGRHTASNALAAIAIARHLGVDDATSIASLAKATGPEMRLQLLKIRGITILNDAYNANPHSMRAALETLRDMAPPATGRKIAILGDMRELGDTAEAHHREMGEFAATCDLDALWCVGEKAAMIAESAAAKMDSALITRFPNAAACAVAATGLLHQGDLVLLKASRGIGLEVVAKAFF
jgi:UDP-N-acetylmuramoyl-tripeptide--D-alanyl-D-alanine ligase